MVLIYCPIITGLSGRTGGNARGRDKKTGRNGGDRAKQTQTEGDRREGLINKVGGWEKAK